MRITRFLTLSVVLLAGNAASGAQRESLEEIRDKVPYGLWLEGRETEQIPWSTYGPDVTIRADLRYQVDFSAVIRRSEPSNNLVLMARVVDRQGRPLTKVQVIEPGPAPGPLGASLLLAAAVRSGRYALNLVLFDRMNGKYNVKFENFEVPAAPNDPLEDSLRDLPLVEFLTKPAPQPAQDRPSPPLLMDIIFGGPTGIRDVFRRIPRSRPAGSRDWVSTFSPRPFPISSTAPIEINVISVLSPPEEFVQQKFFVEHYRATLRNVLNAFSRLEPRNGAIRFTGVDLIHQTVLFDRTPMKALDPEQLAQAIAGIPTATITLDALAKQTARGSFFRSVLEQQISKSEGGCAGGAVVFILIDGRESFKDARDLSPLSVGRACRPLVYHLRAPIDPLAADHIGRLIKPFNPKTFDVESWPEFRDAFRRIYADLLAIGNLGTETNFLRVTDP